MNYIEASLAALGAGSPIVLTGGIGRSGEADLVYAADKVTAEALAFCAKRAHGTVRLALAPSICERLALTSQAPHPGEDRRLWLISPLDAREGITTGRSVDDRARTIRVVVDPASRPRDLVQPGHVQAVQIRGGGVLERQGHSEAGVDLARSAGLAPAAVLCDLLSEDGQVLKPREVEDFCRVHGLTRLSVDAVAEHRQKLGAAVERAADALIPTRYGVFRFVGYLSVPDGAEHLAVVAGDPASAARCLLHVHPGCPLCNAFRGLQGGARFRRLEAALTAIDAAESGVVVYAGPGPAQAAEPGDSPCRCGEVTEADLAPLAAAIMRDLGTGEVGLLAGGGDGRLAPALRACGLTTQLLDRSCA